MWNVSATRERVSGPWSTNRAAGVEGFGVAVVLALGVVFAASLDSPPELHAAANARAPAIRNVRRGSGLDGEGLTS